MYRVEFTYHTVHLNMFSQNIQLCNYSPVEIYNYFSPFKITFNPCRQSLTSTGNHSSVSSTTDQIDLLLSCIWMHDIICLAFLFIIMCFGFNHVVAQISSSFFLLPLPPLCLLLPFLTLLLLLVLRSIELCAYSYMTIFFFFIQCPTGGQFGLFPVFPYRGYKTYKHSFASLAAVLCFHIPTEGLSGSMHV